MSKTITARLLLARMDDDREPSIIGAVDESIWEHWTDEEEDAWIRAGKKTWGIDVDTEFRVVVAQFMTSELVDAFALPMVAASVARPEGSACE